MFYNLNKPTGISTVGTRIISLGGVLLFMGISGLISILHERSPTQFPTNKFPLRIVQTLPKIPTSDGAVRLPLLSKLFYGFLLGSSVKA
jgi:hypothetical protein